MNWRETEENEEGKRGELSNKRNRQKLETFHKNWTKIRNA